MLHTCPNCDVTCAQSATQWTASVHASHMSKLWCNLCSKCYAMDCFGTYLTHFTYLPQPDWRCCCSSCCCCAVLTHARFLGWGGVQWHALYLHTYSMLSNCTCAHVRCYAIVLAHMFDATQLHLGTCSMLRNCTCAHVRCYAIALARMLDATQLHLHTSPRSCPKHISVAYSKWFSKPAR